MEMPPSFTASSVTVTLTNTAVPQAQVWNFVRNTPEGTLLWNALTRWRNHYEEVLQPVKPARKLKKSRRSTPPSNHAVKNKAYFKLKHSYPDCVKYFEYALKNPYIRKEFYSELIAIGQELGLEDHNGFQALLQEHDKKQLSLPLNA